jgi:acetyltransferase-like isoleucine patch superfamily enzyme
LKAIVKSLLHALFLLIAFPFGATAAFGRFRAGFTLWAQFLALVPGLPGDYLRVAYYRLTLEKCHPESRIQFGSFFAHPNATVARFVYIGCYCVLGRCRIGERTQIASGVQILSGRNQHSRSSDGAILGAAHSSFATITIGADCWLGAQAIIMADVGPGTTIGAGGVVVSPIPAGVVAVGNPARILPRSQET